LKDSIVASAGPLHDVKGIYAELRRLGLVDRLRDLQGPVAIRSAGALAFDWGCILVAWALVVRVSPWLAPLAILLIGSRQRALGNLLHDAGHKILFSRPERNDCLANLFLGYPLFSPVGGYRDQHGKHHTHLGLEELDPDLIHSEEDLKGSAFQLFLKHAFDPGMFRSNVVGHLFSLPAGQKLRIALWWGVFLGVLGLASGPAGALTFAGLWMLSRVTLFHAITTFREISDHVGMEPGSVLGFTRNSPRQPILSFWLHPHQNNYHLTHHLAPRVPFHRLHLAHEILMAVPDYAQAHHCDAYFSGRKSVIACWVRRCLSWHRTPLDGAASRPYA
jgi:fatty acid desaturase